MWLRFFVEYKTWHLLSISEPTHHNPVIKSLKCGPTFSFGRKFLSRIYIFLWGKRFLKCTISVIKLASKNSHSKVSPSSFTHTKHIQQEKMKKKVQGYVFRRQKKYTAEWRKDTNCCFFASHLLLQSKVLNQHPFYMDTF